MPELVQIEVTEGERAALARRFPQKQWRSYQPQFTPNGINQVVRKQEELDRRVRIAIGTSKLSPGMAYDAEMLRRVMDKINQAQVNA